jgi:hypothetical protein
VLRYAVDLRRKTSAIRQYKQPRGRSFFDTFMLKFSLSHRMAGFQPGYLRPCQVVDIAFVQYLVHGAKYIMMVHHIAQCRHANVSRSQYGSAKTTAIGNMNGRDRRDVPQSLPYGQALQNETAPMGQRQRA